MNKLKIVNIFIHMHDVRLQNIFSCIQLVYVNVTYGLTRNKVGPGPIKGYTFIYTMVSTEGVQCVGSMVKLVCSIPTLIFSYMGCKVDNKID